MRLKNKVQQMEEEVQDAFNGVEKDVQYVINRHDALAQDFVELRDELATNGVVRDINQLKKDLDALKTGVQEFRELAVEKLHGIDRLKREVTESDKEQSNTWLSLTTALYGVTPLKDYEPTLAGKVDAIIEHLGLDVTVKPGEGRKVVAKKASKKKGKK